MGKIEKILDGLDLGRDDLLALSKEALRRASVMRQIHIKQIYKRCGKPACWCADLGPDEGHGPYLYASWTEGKRQVQKSLGPCCDQEAIAAMRDRFAPDWLDFVLVGKSLSKAQNGPNRWEIYDRTLDQVEFERFYGLPVYEDNLDRPKILSYDRKAYEQALNEWQEQHEIAWSEFAYRFGVCTSKGISTLKSLLARGFYLEW
jgi:hypothetical protein